MGRLKVCALACAALVFAPAAGGVRAAIILHPGQSKKLGAYTVICSASAQTSGKRLALRPGYQVKVGGTIVRCKSGTLTPTPVPTPTPTPTPTPKPTPPPAVGTRTNPFPLGTSAANSTWSVTVNNTNFDAWSVVQAANMFNDAPPAGAQDVMSNLTIKYLGPGSTTLTDLIIHLGTVGQRNVEYTSFGNDCGVLPSPREIDFGTLFSGATIQLNLCWQVSSDDVSTLELVFNDNSWFALK